MLLGGCVPAVKEDNSSLVKALALLSLGAPEKYKAIDDLVNPGRGWTTFNSFNDDKINQLYPRSSIAYLRFYWKDIEPEDGSIQFTKFDEMLATARKNGQRIAFRIMPDAPSQTGIPEWLINKGIAGVRYSSSEGNNIFMPDFGDSTYRYYAARLLTALGLRYNGHADLDHVDIGMVGHWGEWHVSIAAAYGATLPSLAIRKEYIDMYVDNFSLTPVIMLLGDVDENSATALSYAISRGCGWRADSWGDMRSGWNHMINHYPGRIIAGNATEAWKTAPVALETWGTPSDWWWLWGGRLDEILQFAIDNHVSILNAKSSTFPIFWLDAISVFTGKIGYRLSLKASSFPDSVSPASTVPIEMTWSNIGNAPLYRAYDLKVRLYSSSYKTIFPLNVNVRAWLPGDHNVSKNVSIPAGIPPGPYLLQTALTDPATGEAVIRFDMKGGNSDLWYDIKTVTVP